MGSIEEIHFFSQRDAESRIGRGCEAIISITASTIAPAALRGKWGNVLRLVFDDVEPSWAAPGDQVFNFAQAQLVLDFLENLPSSIQMLCIHCRSGISRSGALAKAISESYGLVFDGEEKECNAHVLDMMRKSFQHRQRACLLDNYSQGEKGATK